MAMPGTPSGEEPFLGQPDVRREQDAAAPEIAPDLADVTIDHRVPQGQPQVAETFL